MDIGCGTPTLSPSFHQATYEGALGKSGSISLGSFSSNPSTSCTIKYATAITSSNPASWITELASGRGISWDATDNDSTKLGDYTVTVTATVGCSTETTSFTFTMVDCSSLVSDIDCENSVFVPTSNGVTMTYQLYSGPQSLSWDDAILY